MSEAAVVCPHCGVRQADRDPILAAAHRRATSREDGSSVDPYRGEPAAPTEAEEPRALSVSGEEARALLEVHGIASGAVEYERPRGPLVLIVPRPEATGLTRSLEWLLTFIAAPMIVTGLIPVALKPRLWGYVASGSEWGLTLLSGFMGGIVIWSLGGLAFKADAVTWGLIGLSGGALVARAILRSMRPL